MTGPPEIRQASSPGDIHCFLDYPFRLYRDDPNWVPPLRASMKKLLSQKTAFFNNAEMALFFAIRAGKIVGRVAAIHNRAHNDFHNDRVGFFGFFECGRGDGGAADSLFDSAARWLTARGLNSMRGPVNPSMNAQCGLLVHGFDLPPVALMPYNPEYYVEILKSAGFKKARDMFAYYLEAGKLEEGTPVYDRMVRTSALLARRYPNAIVRSIDMKNIEGDVLKFMPVFEQARKDHWGYVPIAEAEVMEMVSDLKMVVHPELVWMAEVDGRPAGISMAIPDVNAGLKAARGRMFPFGFIRFLRAMKKVNLVRILGIAVLEQYRHMGIAARLMTETSVKGMSIGYRRGEASWVLEDNVMSMRTIEGVLDPVHYKTYRIYEKPL